MLTGPSLQFSRGQRICGWIKHRDTVILQVWAPGGGITGVVWTRQRFCVFLLPSLFCLLSSTTTHLIPQPQTWICAEAAFTKKKCCFCCELTQAHPFAKVWKERFSTGPTWPSTCSSKGQGSAPSNDLPLPADPAPVPGQNSSGTRTSCPGCSPVWEIHEGKTFPKKKEVCRREGLREWNWCPQFAGIVGRKESRELEHQFGTKLRRMTKENDAAWLPQLCSTTCLCRTDANMHTGMNSTLHFFAQKDRRGKPLSQPTCRFFIYPYLETKGNQGNIFFSLKKKVRRTWCFAIFL